MFRRVSPLLLAALLTGPLIHTLAGADDPRYADGSLWGLHNTGQSGGVADADIDAPEGWAIRSDATAVVVGVIDTGVRLTHEDIAANLWVNPGEDGLDAQGNSKRTNGIDDDGNGYVDDVHGINAIDKTGNPADTHGHGTHTAGTVAAVGNNGKGVTGVAWRARVMALKFIEGTSGAVSDAIACIEYASAHGAKVTNNSWGSSEFSQSLNDAIAAAGEAGMLAVAACGNNGENNDIVSLYPADSDLANVIAVAATDRKDELASFSNYGVGTVELAAPGDDILSLGIESDSSYVEMGGTSMASPHVAGVAALVAAQFPASGPVGVKNRILQSTRTVPALIGRVNTGGVVNLPAALQTAGDAPRNDAFARSIQILEDPAVMRGNTIGATMDADEPLHGGAGSASIWYRWTAPADGVSLATTYGSGFDTILAVYTDDGAGGLAEVVVNDDFEGKTWSRVQFDAVKGRSYHFALSGKNGATGFSRLTFAGPVIEDHIADAPAVPSFPFTYSSNNTNATRQPGEPLHAGVAGGGSLWIRLTLADASRRIVINTRNSEFDTLLAVYTAEVPNPTFADLELVAANDDAPYGETFSEVSFTAVQGRTYWIATDGKNGARGILRMSSFAKPANDDFVNATGLAGDAVKHVIPLADLRKATREFGEPNHDNARGTTSLWFAWSPATAGKFNIRTNANTAVGVYTGDTLASLVQVAPDQNSGNGNSLVVVDNAVPGVVYRIAVDTQRQAYIPYDVTVSIARAYAVPNDNWKNAAVLEGVPAADNPLTATSDNTEAGVEPGEPAPALGNTVWFRWVAPVSGQFAVTTNGSAATAALAVYQTNASATSFANIGLVASANNNGIDDDAWLKFSAVAGRVYLFKVGRDSDEYSLAGGVRISIAPFQRPANDDLAGAERLDGFFAQREIRAFGATREADEPAHATDNGYHNKGTVGVDVHKDVPLANSTIWYKWTATDATARRTSASSFGSGTVTVVNVYEGPAENPTYASLVQVGAGASSHWGMIFGWGEFNWVAEAGKTYYIMLGTESPDRHEVLRLSLWQNPNDAFAQRQVLSGNSVTVTSANFAATSEPGEPVHIAGEYGGRSIWYEWTAPESGIYIFDTIHSFLKDRFTDLGLNPDMQNSGGRMQMAVYTGSSLSGLTKVASNNGISMRDYDAMVALNATAGRTYFIAIDSASTKQYALTGPRTEWCYRSVITFNISKGTLDNDNLANARVITGTEYREFIDLRHATREPGEPSHGTRSARSAWWKWTAPESGRYWVATASDIFHTHDNRTPGIAVYSGPAANPAFTALTRIAEGSNSGFSGDYMPARASFTAQAGTTYYIAIDQGLYGTSDHAGFRKGLMLTKPAANDAFAGAIQITGSRRTVHGHNIGATQETGEPDIDPEWKKAGATNSSIWWKWTAPASGLTTVDTKGSLIYGELGVYSGSRLGGLLEVAREITGSNFDNGFTYAERVDLADREVSFVATAGTTYYFLVNGSGYDKQSVGPVTVTVKGQPGKPFAPAGLAATRVTATRIDLNWTDMAVDESTYRIESAADEAGPWREAFNSGEPDTAAWSDLNAAGPVHYRVRAEGPGGVSDWVRISPSSPVSLAAYQSQAGEVTLNWPDTVSESGYRVSVRRSGEQRWHVHAAALPPGATSHRIAGLAPGGAYEFAVAALDGSVERLAARVSLTLEDEPLPPLSALEQWRLQKFGFAAAAGDAADAADPDGDQLPNLLEFALLADPLADDAGTHGPRQELARHNGQWHLHYTYRRRAGTGLQYTLESAGSPAATQWSSGPGVWEQVGAAVANGDGTESVTFRLLQPVGQANIFVRLRVH